MGLGDIGRTLRALALPEPPRSKASPYSDVMPIKGPASVLRARRHPRRVCGSLGVDLTGQSAWPDAPAS